MLQHQSTGLKVTAYPMLARTHTQVKSKSDVLAALWAGAKMRAMTATDMNLYSSRSHTILTLGIERGAAGSESSVGSNAPTTFSKLCLVDLAGSEKVSCSGKF